MKENSFEMNREKVKTRAEKFCSFIKSIYDVELSSGESIVEFALDFECGNTATRVEKIKQDEFVEGLTYVVCEHLMIWSDAEIRWDSETNTFLTIFSGIPININFDIVNTFREGKCHHNLGWFLEGLLDEPCGGEAPLSLSYPSEFGGNYTVEFDLCIDRKHRFLDNIVYEKYINQGSCYLLSISEMTQIGLDNDINIFSREWVNSNDFVSGLSAGVLDWFLGWIIYHECYFHLDYYRFCDEIERPQIAISDGYGRIELSQKFQRSLEKNCDGNPFLAVKSLYSYCMSRARYNRSLAWHEGVKM